MDDIVFIRSDYYVKSLRVGREAFNRILKRPSLFLVVYINNLS